MYTQIQSSMHNTYVLHLGRLYAYMGKGKRFTLLFSITHRENSNSTHAVSFDLVGSE